MNKQQQIILGGTLLIVGTIITLTYFIFLGSNGFSSLSSMNGNTFSSSNVSTMNNGNISEDSLQISPKREGDSSEVVYQMKPTGEECVVINLNDYIPAKDEAEKTYTWIIEFPDDNCVIQQPATNLPETLGETYSETITGTNLRKTVAKYQ